MDTRPKIIYSTYLSFIFENVKMKNKQTVNLKPDGKTALREIKKLYSLNTDNETVLLMSIYTHVLRLFFTGRFHEHINSLTNKTIQQYLVEHAQQYLETNDEVTGILEGRYTHVHSTQAKKLLSSMQEVLQRHIFESFVLWERIQKSFQKSKNYIV